MNDEFKIPETFFTPATSQEVAPVPPEYLPAGISTDSEPWPSRLPFDVALGVDSTDVILERYELESEQFFALLAHPQFQRAVSQHREEITATGLGFKTKARLQAETYLAELHGMVIDRSVSAPTRLDAIKSVVKWAGLSNEGKDGAGSGGGQSTRLVFAWQDGTGQVAVELKNGLSTPDED